MTAETIVCPHCERGRFARFDTDGRGDVVDLNPCSCSTARKERGQCRDCEEPFEGAPGKALRCAVHKKAAVAAASRRWKERHPEKAKAIQEADNARRRQPEIRAEIRERERRYRRTPAGKAAKRRARRKYALSGKAAANKRRYKERHPQRVRSQQRRANRKRRKEAREYMHRYCTKYVGPGLKPICEECGGEVPWGGVGRPFKKCEECDPNRWEQARQRAAQRARARKREEAA